MLTDIKFIIDSEGHKTGVILSIDEYQKLLTKSHIDHISTETKLHYIDPTVEQKRELLPQKARNAKEKLHILKLMEWKRETNEGDISLDEIINSRTISNLKTSFEN